MQLSGHNQGNQSGHLDDDPGCTSCCETWEDWGLGRGCINANTNECLNNERAFEELKHKRQKEPTEVYFSRGSLFVEIMG